MGNGAFYMHMTAYDFEKSFGIDEIKHCNHVRLVIV